MKIVYNGFLKIGKIETADGMREICLRPDAVACLIYDENGNVLLTNQIRIAPSFYHETEIFYEVPAGMIDKDETPLKAVIREVFEEVGLKIDDPMYWGKYYSSPGGLSERIYLYSFQVEDLKSIQFKPQKDKYENIEIHIKHYTSIAICDMKTALLIEKVFEW